MDRFERTIHHRSILIADTPLFTLAERTRLRTLLRHADRYNGIFATSGAEHSEFVAYALGDDDGTFDLTLLGLPTALDRMPNSQAPLGPRPLRLGKWGCTLGISTETNLNPVTGESVTGTWRAVDTLVTTVAGTGITLYDEGGDDGVSRIVINNMQIPHLFMYADNFTNVTRVEIQTRRLASLT